MISDDYKIPYDIGATPVILYPSGPAYVCGGHQLDLLRTTTGRFQEWDFSISDNGTTITPPGRLVNNQPYLILPALTVNSFSFNFSRVSPANSLLLVTKLVITSARSSVNGTEVTCICTDVITDVSSSTTVLVINKNTVVKGVYVSVLTCNCSQLNILYTRSPCSELHMDIGGVRKWQHQYYSDVEHISEPRPFLLSHKHQARNIIHVCWNKTHNWTSFQYPIQCKHCSYSSLWTSYVYNKYWTLLLLWVLIV